MISLLSVSASRGLTFSGPVSSGAGGVELTILDTTVYNQPELIGVTGVTVVPIFTWVGGPAPAGHGWSFTPPPSLLTALAPAVGFAPGSGVIVD